MKNALLIVNGLLVVAVAFLLYKQFNQDKKAKPATVRSDDKKDSASNQHLLFAYIDTDSIQVNYELAKVVQNEIRRKESAITAEIDRMEKNYKNKLAGYQQKQASMTPEQMEAAGRDVQQTQQQIMEKRQSLTEDFNSFVASKNMSVMKEIKDFLKTFNQDGKYSFIFSYEPGLFYYKDTSFDVTSEVLKGLNAQYKAKK
ncbi:MAG: outer membrane chaperone Skp [Sphingobacteriales bacterium 41-5]|nr:MAG: outer membrane chaperone Skp [Sphingobacteriales bacterium 41-5]